REIYQQYVADRTKPASLLQGQLEELMKRAIADREVKGENREVIRDLEERRRAIADVLYNLSPDPNWHTRVQTVVGLKHYIGAADRQAANLQQIASRLNAAIADEQATFVRHYRSYLPQLQLLSEHLKDLDGRLKEQQDLLQKHTVLRNARQTEVAEFQKKIQDATATVATETATLDRLHKQLFALQQEVASAQERNQQLERELRTRETGK